jgi:hypothetical protein
MRPILRCAKEWVGANLANQRCTGGILRDDRSFWSSQRINDAADRQLSRPNNKER